MFVNRSGQNEQFYRGPSIDASYHVSVHLAKRFQRRRFKKKTPIWNKNCLWRPYMLMDRDKMCNLYREPSIDVSYQVPSCGSFGSGVSEENIKMWKVNGWQTTDAKWWQKLTLPLARWANNKMTFILGYHKEKNSIDKQQNFTSN